MARSKPRDRSIPVAMPHQAEHDKMMSDMHSALYALADKVRKPFDSVGNKLLPKELRPKDPPEAAAAKLHIKQLHKTFKKAAKD